MSAEVRFTGDEVRFPDDSVASDTELMARLAAGDDEALSLLYDRYSGRACAVAYRILGDMGAAEEVVQELFLYLWHHAADYRPQRASLSTWLMLIGRSRALDRIRHRRVLRRTRRDYKLERGGRSAENDGYPAVLDAERSRAVRDALATLPEEQRRVLELAYFRGLTQRRIADRMAIPLGTVKTRTSLAMKKLRRALGGEAAALI